MPKEAELQKLFEVDKNLNFHLLSPITNFVKLEHEKAIKTKLVDPLNLLNYSILKICILRWIVRFSSTPAPISRCSREKKMDVTKLRKLPK